MPVESGQADPARPYGSFRHLASLGGSLRDGSGIGRYPGSHGFQSSENVLSEGVEGLLPRLRARICFFHEKFGPTPATRLESRLTLFRFHFGGNGRNRLFRLFQFLFEFPDLSIL